MFEYKVKLGYKEIKLYADTDIEEFFNINSIDYVRNMTDTVENRQLKEIDRLNKEIDRLNYIKSKATNYLIKAIKIDSEDDNCMCLERHEYKILLDMLLNRELKENK